MGLGGRRSAAGEGSGRAGARWQRPRAQPHSATAAAESAARASRAAASFAAITRRAGFVTRRRRRRPATHRRVRL